MLIARGAVGPSPGPAEDGGVIARPTFARRRPATRLLVHRASGDAGVTASGVKQQQLDGSGGESAVGLVLRRRRHR